MLRLIVIGVLLSFSINASAETMCKGTNYAQLEEMLSCIKCGMQEYNPKFAVSNRWLLLLASVSQEYGQKFKTSDLKARQKFHQRMIEMIQDFGFCTEAQYDGVDVGAPESKKESARKIQKHIEFVHDLVKGRDKGGKLSSDDDKVQNTFQEIFGINNKEPMLIGKGELARLFGSTLEKWKQKSHVERQQEFMNRLNMMKDGKSENFMKCVEQVKSVITTHPTFSFSGEDKVGDGMSWNKAAVQKNEDFCNKVAEACDLQDRTFCKHERTGGPKESSKSASQTDTADTPAKVIHDPLNDDLGKKGTN